MPAKTPRFIHLHTHSHYSLLEALPKIPDLVKKAKKSGMDALALTDAGNLYGAIEFYKECIENEIKPIIGVDFYVAIRTRHDKEARIDNARTRLVLLAENETGYQNLLKLVTASYLEGFYYKPRIDKELIEKYKEGLIAIFPSFVRVNVEELITYYQKVFGPGNFFIEITHHPEIAEHDERMEERIKLAKKHNIPLVAAHDIYYLEPEDKPARDTVLSIQGYMGGGNGGVFNDGEEDFSFITQKTAGEYFKDLPEALENTGKIADRCTLKLELGKWVVPDMEMPGGVSPEEALRNAVYAGLERRKLDKNPEVEERIEYELKIIENKGFPKYLMVVSDLLRYAHENGILTNVRGSVAGSLVGYLVGITNINPLEYKLPFERFLNPDRPSAPDIDMDFADNRRDEVIEYARQKYGASHVAQIGTFGTMMARGVTRDVTRALGFPYELGDRIAKMIPMGAQGFPMTIQRAFKESPELKELYESDEDVKTILDMAQKIEGNARHISVHAAGVVIAPKPLTLYTALQYDTKGENKIITQYDMYSIEEAGLLKFDFLGIRNLSIIADTFERIKKLEGKEIRLEDIPLDDKKTFEMLARGETEGTFQLNGSGMTKALMELKPTSIHDINVMVALYRPGPMDNINEYIARKHGKKPVIFLHPKMKSYLDTTYGVLVYQDDLLMTAIEVAGYSWGEVDKFRKAVGKKIPEEMAAQKEKFIAGCVKYQKWPEKKAKELWTWIEPFAAYGFNKAHSVSYGRVAYQTAYLKANYPGEYMTAVLIHEAGDVEKVAESIKECKRLGIPVLPPSVNESQEKFTLIRGEAGDTIRFGLNSIKNFGEGIARAIFDERAKGGQFKSLSDFLSRVKDKNLNKKSLEALVKSGALDEFADRAALYGNLDKLLEYNKERAKGASNHDSLFGSFAGHDDIRLETVAPVTKGEMLVWEKDLLGLYISGHPLDKYKAILEKRPLHISTVKAKAQKELEELKKVKEDMVVLGSIIEEVRVIMTKKNEPMAFLRMTDLTGSIEAVAFPRTYARFKSIIAPERCVALKAKVSERNGEISLIADNFMALQ